MQDIELWYPPLWTPHLACSSNERERPEFLLGLTFCQIVYNTDSQTFRFPRQLSKGTCVGLCGVFEAFLLDIFYHHNYYVYTVKFLSQLHVRVCRTCSLWTSTVVGLWYYQHFSNRSRDQLESRWVDQLTHSSEFFPKYWKMLEFRICLQFGRM